MRIARPSVVLAAIAVGVAAVLVLGGCTATAPTPTPTITPTPTATPSGNGTLVIGALLPQSGVLSYLAPAQAAGIAAAVREIDAAGGVRGAPVQVITRDSGDTSTATAEAAFADLVAQGADVVIGPSSSALAERLIAPAAAAHVPLITPAATYPQLTTADPDGWLFRTIASTAGEGAALASFLLGKELVPIVVISAADDPAGRALAEGLGRAVSAAGGGPVITGDAAGDPAAVAAQAAQASPAAVVLATSDNGDRTRALIGALGTAGLGGSKLWLTSGNLADYSQALPAGTLTDVNGILAGAPVDDAFAARLRQEDPALGDTRFAAEAYDAVILAALAAETAGDDGGASIRVELAGASRDGIRCASYAECRTVLAAGDDIDYDGVTGTIDLDAAGDPAGTTFGIERYDAKNQFSRVETARG